MKQYGLADICVTVARMKARLNTKEKAMLKEWEFDATLAPRWSAEGDDATLIRNAKLVPIRKRGEPLISLDEALRRARANPLTNRGERFAKKLADDLNAGRVSCKNWQVGQCVIFGKDSWRVGGVSLAWYVDYRRDGFYCGYSYFTDAAVSHCYLLRLDA